MIDTVWNKIKDHCQYKGYTDYTQLFQDFNFPELLKLHRFNQWSERGLVYIPQLHQGQHLKKFQTQQEEFDLPTKSLFQYLQLMHAIQTQARQFPWVYDTFTNKS